MKILVTGAAGFIGSYVSRALIWRGDAVVGIDNFNDYYPKNCKDFNVDLVRMASNLNPQTNQIKEVASVYKKLESYKSKTSSIQNGAFKFYEGDITNFSFLKKIFKEERIDAIIHLAAMAGVPYSTKNPRIYANVNVDGTTNLLTLSKDYGIQRFVFASSSSVYGNREDKKVTEEDDVMKAVSVYGASKVAGEVVCHAFNVIFGTPIIINRIFGPIYGPLQRPYGMFHQRAINYAHNNKIITIYGKKGLETGKDSTYIDDQIDGILKCLDSDYKFEVFNIGTSDPKPIKVWIDTIEKALNKKLNLKIIDADKADVISSANISKACRMLDYSPKADMYEGVRRQVEIFRLMPAWYQGIKNV
jgi:UDP-glucuronate 4-epimerase